MRSTPAKRKTLLIIRLSALGDVAMTIPAIYSFARQYPQWDVKVLTSPFFARLFLNHPVNVSFLIFDKKKGLLHLLKTLRHESVDKVADFHNLLRSWCIDAFFLLRGKPVCMLRKQRGKRKELTSRNGKSPVSQRPYTQRYFDVLERLDFPVRPDFTSLFQEIQPAVLSGILPERGKEHWVGIAPFARYMNKTYPVELMEQTVALLAQTPGYQVFLFGGRGQEAERLQEWASMYDDVRSLAGLLPIEQELAAMSQLDVMVSMDSANMHLASLAGIPVVSIWGSTTPECGFLGWHQKLENALVARLDCQPCTIAGSEHCKRGDLACLKAITPRHIIQQIKQVTEKT